MSIELLWKNDWTHREAPGVVYGFTLGVKSLLRALYEVFGEDEEHRVAPGEIIRLENPEGKRSIYIAGDGSIEKTTAKLIYPDDIVISSSLAVPGLLNRENELGHKLLDHVCAHGNYSPVTFDLRTSKVSEMISFLYSRVPDLDKIIIPDKCTAMLYEERGEKFDGPPGFDFTGMRELLLYGYISSYFDITIRAAWALEDKVVCIKKGFQSSWMRQRIPPVIMSEDRIDEIISVGIVNLDLIRTYRVEC